MKENVDPVTHRMYDLCDSLGSFYISPEIYEQIIYGCEITLYVLS
jgi:hypothetical protein